MVDNQARFMLDLGAAFRKQLLLDSNIQNDTDTSVLTALHDVPYYYLADFKLKLHMKGKVFTVSMVKDYCLKSAGKIISRLLSIYYLHDTTQIPK